VIYSFNQFKLDTDQFSLSALDKAIPVEPLVFNLLVYLVENRQRVVTREELLDNLWKGKVVTDAALGARLKDARKAVGDSGSRQQVIKTLHGRGYQFIAEVSESLNPSPTPIADDSIVQTDFPTLPDKPSIAVLPFSNLSNNPEQEYFSDGITNDIITALSKIKNLLVIASSSTAIYRRQSVDVTRVGREQGVHYVLEGSVRKAANRIRVSVQLIDAQTGQHVWGERFDRELADIFAVQDEIMREIVVALDVELIEGEQARAWSSGTTNLEAWECVRLGSYYAVHRSEPDIKLKAQQLIEKALQLDPSYAIAWVMLGWIYQQYVDVASLASAADSRDSTLASMLDCAHKALAADPSCADAYGLLAMYHLEVKAYDQALEMAEKSIALAPNNAINLGEASMIMNKTGNPQRALELKKRAMRVCPMYRPGFLRGLGLSYYLLGQFDRAIRAFKESIARESEYLSAHTNLAAIFGELENRLEAEATVREIIRLAPDFSIKAYMAGLSFSDPEVLTRMEAGLRKAGLPE
jgi:TolB-like protein/Tfp pilus assembly protein PilF